MKSPEKSLASSHHIEGNNSREAGQIFLSVQTTESQNTPAENGSSERGS
jgi:hypothetical protein